MQTEFLKGNWPMAESLQVYCPYAYKTTTGGVEIYPLALNPENEDEGIWIYSDPEETIIMQGSWSSLFATIQGQGYEIHQCDEHRTLMASIIVAKKRGEYEQRRKGSA